MYCTQCPNFTTKSQSDYIYFIPKKYRAPKSIVIFMWKLCHQQFPGFYALRQHKNTQHGFSIKTANVGPDGIINDVDDANLKEELRSFQHFLVNSELERSRHKVFNYAIDNLNAKSVDEKFDQFFYKLKGAAKVNLAFGLEMKNIEEGGFRYFYAHENNTLLDRSKLVCTHDDLAKFKDFLNKTDIIDFSGREWMKKTEVLQTDKINRICCFTHRRIYGVQGRSLTRTTFENLHNQLCHIWREHKTTIWRQPLSFSCSYSPFARKSTSRRRNFRIIQLIHQ